MALCCSCNLASTPDSCSEMFKMCERLTRKLTRKLCHAAGGASPNPTQAKALPSNFNAESKSRLQDHPSLSVDLLQQPLNSVNGSATSASRNAWVTLHTAASWRSTLVASRQDLCHRTFLGTTG